MLLHITKLVYTGVSNHKIEYHMTLNTKPHIFPQINRN